jgi:hypothetical protein
LNDLVSEKKDEAQKIWMINNHWLFLIFMVYFIEDKILRVSLTEWYACQIND